MMRHDDQRHTDDGAHNQPAGTRNFFPCPIFSARLFERIDEILPAKSKRRTRVRPSAGREFEPRPEHEWLREASGLTSPMQGLRIANNWGWDPQTLTMDVVDPRVLPVSHKQITVGPSEITISYEELFDSVARLDESDAREVSETFRARGLRPGMSHFIQNFVKSVFIPFPPPFAPDPIFHYVRVNAELMGGWPDSPRGEIAYVPVFQVDIATARALAPDVYGRLMAPSAGIHGTLRSIRHAIDCGSRRSSFEERARDNPRGTAGSSEQVL